MNIFPTILDSSEEIQLQKDEQLGTLEPLFDFKTKKIVIRDGKVVMASWKEQVQQWITLLLKTEIDKFNVYKGTDFGMMNLFSLQGQQYLFTNFGISEVKRELQEKIELNSRVEEVKNIVVTSSFDTLKIELTVILKQEPKKNEKIKSEFEMLDINFNLGLEGEVIYFEWSV